MRLTDHYNGPIRAPAWFRYGVIALATLVLCSCSQARPEYRVAHSSGASIRGQSPNTISVLPGSEAVSAEIKLVDADIKLFNPAIPTHLSDDEIEQAQPLPEDFKLPLCTFGGCSCCDEAPIHEPHIAADIPTHLTSAQIDQALVVRAGFETPPCAAGGCFCCNNAPIRGPNDEYLCDGGDFGLPAGVRADWKIEGLEQEDTIAHYETIDGRTIVTPSNKLCIYAPRFAAVRQVIDLRAYAQYHAPVGAIQPIGPVKTHEQQGAVSSLADIEPSIDRAREPASLLRERKQPGELDRDRRAAAIIGSLAPYANFEIIRTGTIIGEDRMKVARASLAAIAWAGYQAPQVMLDSRRAHAEVSVQSPGTIYHLLEPNNPKLRLCKLASKGAAVPGEEVEFTLRFDNVGDRVIGNVTIVDNLTTRLEYVPESQKSTLEANFFTQPNEGDSLVLRWEIIEPLPPGKGGVLQFRARVR